MARRAALLSAAAALAAAACTDSVSGPAVLIERDSLEFGFVPVDASPSLFAPAEVTMHGGPGRININGYVVAPCETWIMRAGLTRGSDGFHLRLFYRLASEFCEHPVRHRWHAVIVGLPAGDHHVRVRQPIFDRERRSFVVVTVAESRVQVAPMPQ